MTTEFANSSIPIGAATKSLEGRQGVSQCYGTFAKDIPDQNFRLHISYAAHDEDFPPHRHEYSELGVVLGGSAIHVMPDLDHPLEAGDVFVIHGQNWHGFRSARQLKLCNIMFDPRQFFTGQRQLETMVGWQALFELGPRASPAMQKHERLQLAPSELTYSMGLLIEMHEEYEKHPDGWQASLYGHFLTLAAFLCRVYARKTKEQTTPLLRFARVISHIQQNLHEPLRMPLLAKIAHLSVRQFQREFQRIYNTTPVRFVSQMRLREACDRLKDPDSEVTSVAVDLGYSSVSFFSKQFKQSTGFTPSEFRQRWKKECEEQGRHKLMIESLGQSVSGPAMPSKLLFTKK